MDPPGPASSWRRGDPIFEPSIARGSLRATSSARRARVLRAFARMPRSDVGLEDRVRPLRQE